MILHENLPVYHSTEMPFASLSHLHVEEIIAEFERGRLRRRCGYVQRLFKDGMARLVYQKLWNRQR